MASMEYSGLEPGLGSAADAPDGAAPAVAQNAPSSDASRRIASRSRFTPLILLPDHLMLQQQAHAGRPRVVGAGEECGLIVDDLAGLGIADLHGCVVLGLGDARDHSHQRLF